MLNTETIAASQTPIGTRYALVAVPGTELTDADNDAIAIAKVKAMFEQEYCFYCGVEVPAPGACEDCAAWISDPSPLYVNEEAAAAYLSKKRDANPVSLAFEQSERELGERIGYPALVYGPTTKQCDGYPQLTGCPNTATTNIFGVWNLCDTCGTRFRVADEQSRQIAALRADLDDAHQHVGALGAATDGLLLIAGTEHTEAHEEIVMFARASSSAARAWLRRRRE